MDMTCWSKEKVSSFGQIYFIGYAMMALISSLPETIGRTAFVKQVLIPILIQASLFSQFINSYHWRCFGYFLVGLSSIKFGICFIMLTEVIPLKYQALPSTILEAWITLTTGSYCFFMLYVSRNCFVYMHVFNALYLITCILVIAFVVESPRWLIL